jgi:hypothetical protein
MATPPVRAALSTTLLVLLLATPLSAQYFGQNKVQYERFDFQVLETAHFDLYFYPEEKESTAHAARMAERWYARLADVLGHRMVSRQPVVLYASHPHFEQTNVIEGFIDPSTGGVTEGLKRRVVMPMAGPLRETDHVLGHELVHAFQYDIAGQAGRGFFALPLWFVEGMAEYLSLGAEDPLTAMWLRDAALRDELPTLDDLNDPRYFPYRFGHALWAYVAGRWGDAVVGEALRVGSTTGDPEAALQAVTGLSGEELAAAWHAAIREAYAPVLRSEERAPGTVIASEDQTRGRLHVSPALSPDGRLVAYLSEQGQISIDVYLADTETGRVRRTLVSTAADPHFDNLQFLEAAGAFDPTGQRFALTAVRRGRPVISIVDVERGRRVQEIALGDAVDEVFQPTWAPDGGRIAIAANRGGLSDLFVVTLATGEVRALTADAYADLQPAWSPDGRTLVFVTDRFTSELGTLAHGDYRLARLDVESGRIEPVRAFSEGKHINPQWGPGGRSIYFLANPDGVTNVYRMPAAGGAPEKLTGVRTGVSGITGLSPALSVATETGQFAYSVQNGGGYDLRVAPPVREAGADTTSTEVAGTAGRLPPERRSDPEVPQLLGNPTAGLPSEPPAAVTDYKPRLQLDAAGQTGSVGVGTDPFGAYLGGGIALQFSDILANHLLSTVLQVNGQVQDIGGQAAYLNRTRRWQWGGVVAWIPYRTGSYGEGLTTIEGQTALVQQTEVYRQTDRQVAGVLVYPFSRARRFEVSSGFRQIAYDRELQTVAVGVNTGNVLIDSTEDLPTPESLNLFESAAALVYDSSVLGPTSPILGRRYRLEVSPTAGDVSFTSLLADVRQYVSPIRPLTLAGRVLYAGRHGGGAEDDRLPPMYLGYSNLVRGYEFDSFSADECVSAGTPGCPVYDRLLGSRLAVANAELRVPLVGAFTGRYDYGPIPAEIVAFADGGVAWGRGQNPRFTGANNDWVSSVGVGLRVNALGFAVLEFDAVRPLDRPRQGWMFSFGLRPGF